MPLRAISQAWMGERFEGCSAVISLAGNHAHSDSQVLCKIFLSANLKERNNSFLLTKNTASPKESGTKEQIKCIPTFILNVFMLRRLK